MSENDDFAVRNEAEKDCLQTQKETQRIRDALGKSNAEILSGNATSTPSLPLDYLVKEHDNKTPERQKPDWAFRIALLGILLLLFLGILGGVAAVFGWEVWYL